MMVKIPIRITVLGLFLFLSTIILGAMFYIQANLSEELSKKAMNDYFKIVSLKIEKNIELMNNTNESLIKASTPFIHNMKNSNITKNEDRYLKIFSNILKNTDKLYSIYIGFSDNKFYEIIKLDINKKLRKSFNAKETDLWLQIEIIDVNIKKITLFDKNFQSTAIREVKNSYLPTTRPWYKNSIKTYDITKTGPYQFSNINNKGITYSKKINDNTIFAIDVLVNNFSEILNNNNLIKSLESYIFKQNGNILATSSKENNIYNNILKKVNIKDLTQPIQGMIIIDNKNYIYNISSINSKYDNKEYLLSYVLLEEMSSPYQEKFNKVNAILIILILLLLPLMWFFASVIVKPILSLIDQCQKVKDRDFDKVVPVPSLIYEVEVLSFSLKKMASSLHNHQTKLEQMVKDRTEELNIKNKQLEILSITDKLTRTFNRVKLDEIMDQEIYRVNRYNAKFGIIMIDIDDFKEVNDTYGHQVGDKVLIEFANILKRNTRKIDIVSRWGGEEFIIIALQCDLSKVMKHAETLRSHIEKYNFSSVEKRTASFGVSTYRKGETAQELVRRADEALYLAKNTGKNKVETIEKDKKI